MNKSLPVLAASLMTVAALLDSGCEWSGGGGANSFNTSQGAGINVNFTGVYKGDLGGGKAVSQTSAGNITQLTISQVGNTLQVIDNQGSTYSGTVGSPGLVTQPASDGTFPAGAEVVESQIEFTGKDGVAAKDITFVGVMHVITVTDVKGNTKTQTSSSSSGSGSTNSTSSSSTTDTGNTVTKSVNDGTNTTTTTIVTIDNGVVVNTVTTTVVTDNVSGKELSRNVTSQEVSKSGSSQVNGSQNTTTTTATTTYNITEQQSQWRMQGTWVEKGGVTANVDAISPGGSTTITTTTTATK